ncbi:hypothetical protein BH11PSE12_BH11PSE12_20460 [soil metagenome]
MRYRWADYMVINTIKIDEVDYKDNQPYFSNLMNFFVLTRLPSANCCGCDHTQALTFFFGVFASKIVHLRDEKTIQFMSICSGNA